MNVPISIIKFEYRSTVAADHLGVQATNALHLLEETTNCKHLYLGVQATHALHLLEETTNCKHLYPKENTSDT